MEWLRASWQHHTQRQAPYQWLPIDLLQPSAHTTSNEIAHHWAGEQTTLLETHDFVWKEAMAEYLVFVHKTENIEARI
ncbi:MAG: hypothetical protein GY811_14675 [Myxococcales bacterium]|nr:hypothetical protein [Myxococcales bacterium]